MILVYKRSDLFLYVQKSMKKIAWEEDFIHEVNLCYIYWIKQTQQTQPCMIFFFISKSAILKKKK